MAVFDVGWSDISVHPDFLGLSEAGRRRVRDNYFADNFAKHAADNTELEHWRNKFNETSEHTVLEDFNPLVDKEEGWTPYAKAFAYGATKGLTGGWFPYGGRERFYKNEDERQQLQELGLPLEKKWGYIDEAKDSPITSLLGEAASILVPLGIFSKIAYVPRALRGLGYGLRVLRGGVKGLQIGAMYGAMRKPEGEAWENLDWKNIPWTDQELLERKMKDILFEAGFFGGIDMALPALGGVIALARKMDPSMPLKYAKQLKQANKQIEEAGHALRNEVIKRSGFKKAGKMYELAGDLGSAKRTASEILLRAAEDGGVKFPEDLRKTLSGGLTKEEMFTIPKRVQQSHELLARARGLQEEAGGIFGEFGETWQEVMGQRSAQEKAPALVFKLDKVLREFEALEGKIGEVIPEDAHPFLKKFGRVPHAKEEFEMWAGGPVTEEAFETATKQMHTQMRTAPNLWEIRNYLDRTVITGTDMWKAQKQLMRFVEHPDIPESTKDILSRGIFVLHKAKQAARFSGTFPGDLLTMGQKALGKHTSILNQGRLWAHRIERTIQELANEGKFAKGWQERVTFYMHGKDQAWLTERGYGMMSPAETEVGEWLRSNLDEFFDILQSRGVIFEYRPNYFPLLWKEERDRVLNLMKNTEHQWFKELEPVKRSISDLFPFAKPRKFEIDVGMNEGLTPITNPGFLMRNYIDAMFKTLANKNLADTLQSLKVPIPGGKGFAPAMVLGKMAIPGAEGLWKKLNIKGLTGEVKVAPQFYKALKDVFDPSIRPAEWGKFYNGYRSARTEIKKLIMYNPWIHGVNILSDVINEMLTWNPLQWPVGLYKAAKIFNPVKNQNKLDKTMERFVIAGGELANVSQWGTELFEQTERQLARHLPMGDWLREVLSTRPYKIPGRAYDRGREFIDRWLWDKMVTNSQLGLFEHTIGLLNKAHPGKSTEFVDQAAAHYVNDLMGMLPRHVFTAGEREALSAMFFARNWCVPASTRALTKVGWKYHHELRVDDEIMIFDPDTKKLKFAPIRDMFIRNDYGGLMIKLDNYNRTIEMTPEHTCYTWNFSKGKHEVVKAKDIKTSHVIPRTGVYDLSTKEIFDDLFIRIVGWMVTDGYIRYNGNTPYGIISQSKEGGRKDLQSLGLHSYMAKSRETNFGVGKPAEIFYVPTNVIQLMIKCELDKGLNFNFLNKLTKRQLELLHDTMMLGDGTGQRRFCGKEKEINMMSLIYAMLGKPQTFYKQEKNCWRSRIVSGMNISTKRKRIENYNGTIWCPSVDSGFWLAENNGLVFITGNTISNLRLITGAIGFGAPGGKVTKAVEKISPKLASRFTNTFSFLRHTDVTTEQLQALRKLYLNHVVKGVYKLAVSASLFQYMSISMTNYLKDKGLLDEDRFGPIVSQHGLWENEPGHRLDIDTGVRDRDGKPLYMANFLFRYIHDYLKWMGIGGGEGPVAGGLHTFYNKMEPLSKSLLELCMNYSVWQRKPIVPTGMPLHWEEKAKEKGIPGGLGRVAAHLFGRGQYVLYSVTPADDLFGRPGYDKEFWQATTEFLTGSYFRRGLTTTPSSWKTMRRDQRMELWRSFTTKEKDQLKQGLQDGVIRGDVAHKILNQRQKWGYERDLIDQKWEKLIRDGKWDEAKALIIRTRRFVDKKAFGEKVRKYRKLLKYYKRKAAKTRGEEFAY